MDIKVLNFIEDEYAVKRAADEQALFTIPGSRLREDDGIQELITVYAPLVNALEPAAAGAYAAGRLSTLCAAMHYMVAGNELIDLSPDCWTLEIGRHAKGYYDFRYILTEVRPQSAPSPGERDVWRRQKLMVFYRDHLRPMMEALHRTTGLNTGQLWGQLPLRMKHALEQAAAQHESIRERMADDWNCLTKQLEPALFGERKNPFDVSFRTVDYHGAPGEPDRTLRMKPACCLYYRTEGGEYCYTCPRLKPEDRERRKEAVRAELAAQAEATNV